MLSHARVIATPKLGQTVAQFAILPYSFLPLQYTLQNLDYVVLLIDSAGGVFGEYSKVLATPSKLPSLHHQFLLDQRHLSTERGRRRKSQRPTTFVLLPSPCLSFRRRSSSRFGFTAFMADHASAHHLRSRRSVSRAVASRESDKISWRLGHSLGLG